MWCHNTKFLYQLHVCEIKPQTQSLMFALCLVTYLKTAQDTEILTIDVYSADDHYIGIIHEAS